MDLQKIPLSLKKTNIQFQIWTLKFYIYFASQGLMKNVSHYPHLPLIPNFKISLLHTLCKIRSLMSLGEDERFSADIVMFIVDL